jgi:hypothetical protein
MNQRSDKTMIMLLTGVMLAGVWGSTASAEPAHASLKETELPSVLQVRDPFWVKGHKPPVAVRQPDVVNTNTPVGPVAVPKWPVLEPTGFLNSSKGDIVIIRGIGMVEEGQNAAMVISGLEYVFKITKIKAAEKKMLYEKVEVRKPRPAKVVIPDKLVLH